jgi:CRISPR-associated protein Csd1
LKPEEAGKLQREHIFFIRQLRAAASAMPVLAMLANALEDANQMARINTSLAGLDKPAKPQENATFRVDGHEPPILVESDAWREWYLMYRQTLQKNKSDRRIISLASGEPVTPTRTHPKVTGLNAVGGQAAGDVLASFKQPAFCHYGFEQSENSPLSDEEAAAYAGAMNQLLRDRAVRFVGAKTAYWYSRPLPDDFEPVVDSGVFARAVERSDEEQFDEGDAEPEDVEAAVTIGFEGKARKLLESIRNGEVPEAAAARFHLLTLAANSGRVIVRDMTETDLAALLEALLRWRERLSVTRISGQTEVIPAKLEGLLTAVLAPKSPAQKYADWIKPVHRLRDPLFREAIGSGSGGVLRLAVMQMLPHWRASIMKGEFSDAIASDKARAGRARINARVALMKAFLLREGYTMEPGLKKDHPDDAYHYGRLLAVLADLQRTALGDVGAGVIQRYYPRASTAPADALGPLIRLSNSHLDKIDRGLANYLQNRIAEIFAAIHGQHPPQTLDPSGQSLFAMGFYQQIAYMNKEIAANAALKRLREAATRKLEKGQDAGDPNETEENTNA